MARKNRVSVYDGIYHVTARIANRAMLLSEESNGDSNCKFHMKFSGIV